MMKRSSLINERADAQYESKYRKNILASRTERNKLLRAGFFGKQIEALYVMLNHFEFISVNWVMAQYCEKCGRWRVLRVRVLA